MIISAQGVGYGGEDRNTVRSFMRVHILCSTNKPFRVYSDEQEAYNEYRRLQDMDDYIDYSVISMPVQQPDTPDAQSWCSCDCHKVYKFRRTCCDRVF